MLDKDLFTLKEKQKATREGFGEALLEIGSNEKVVALCADLTESVKMDAFRNKYEDRFFEMGIAEQAMAAVASGMASMGYNPFLASYATFSPGRNWEQIRTTICYNNQPVKVVGAHAGISVGPDGATHQALEDISIMRVLPNMNIFVPCDAKETYEITKFFENFEHPAYLRLTREKTPVILNEDYKFNFGKAYIIHLPKKVCSHKVGIIACGPIIYEAIKASIELEKEGIGVTVVNMPTVKPLDEQFLLRFAKTVSAIVTVEEHQITGGLGSAVTEFLSEHYPMKVTRIGILNRFGQSGKPKELYEEYGLTSKYIEEKVKTVIS